MTQPVEGPEHQFRLDGQTVILTGASSGLGRHFASVLAAAGASVVAVARRGDRLQELAHSISGITPIVADVSSEADLERTVSETLQTFDKIDVLVNNAGTINVSDAELESKAEFERVVEVNLTATFLASRLVSGSMRSSGGGSIINLSSILGLVGCGSIPQASYAASKGGVVSLTRELSAQWAKHNIRVNAIAPGWFPSEMTADMLATESGQAWITARTPMGRPGRLDELDGILLLLASRASTYITGQTFCVDGGWTAI